MDELAKLRIRQYEILHTAQLRAAGVSADAIRWRVRKGDWQRSHPKVIALFSGRLTRKQELIAAHLHAGPSAQIAGWTALELHGFRYAPRQPEVQVLVPQARAVSSSPRIRIIRTIRLDESAWPNGILRVCSPARAVVDALRGEPDLRLARAIVAEALQRDHATVTALAHELKHAPRNGTALLRGVLTDVAGGARSAPEAELRAIARGSRLFKHITWNPTLIAADGRRLPSPDAYLEDAGLAVEVDSHEFHLSSDGWQRTMTHANGLGAAGITVLRFTPARIRREPQAVLADIEAAYRARLASGGPPPGIRVIAVSASSHDRSGFR